MAGRCERQIEGLGKNLLTEHNRKLGVRAYSMMIRLYLLRVREEREDEE